MQGSSVLPPKAVLPQFQWFKPAGCLIGLEEASANTSTAGAPVFVPTAAALIR